MRIPGTADDSMDLAKESPMSSAAVLQASPFTRSRPQHAAQLPADALRGQLSVDLPLRHAGMRRQTLRWETFGDADLPAIVVQGGISAGRHLAASPRHPEAGWWDAQIGIGKALDPADHRLVGIDWIGADGELDAPIDSTDQATAIAAVLDTLGIERLHAFVGCSYGAMVGLAFAEAYPQRLARLVAISGAHRPHPYASAWRALQRKIVALGQLQCADAQGLSLARQLAMLSYRTPEEFGERFDAPVALDGATARCAAEDYLDACGARYAERWPATAFLRLSESIDLHRVDPASIRVPTHIVAIADDRLVPLSDLRALAAELAAPAYLHVLRSRYGHDAFLKEADAIATCLDAALESSLGGHS
jgi:homoserine O-acetyltransferase/O-succinyltransferase